MGKLSESISRFVRAEPELLGLLRDLQPLILMGSFSLVVATFAASLSPGAAGYAVGAAMGFLTAFSLILFGRLAKAIDKDFDSDYFALSAYISIGIGLILLSPRPACPLGQRSTLRLGDVVRVAGLARGY